MLNILPWALRSWIRLLQRMDDDEATVDVNVIFNIALDVNGKQIDILQEIMAILADKDVMGQLVKADTPQDVMNILKKEG